MQHAGERRISPYLAGDPIKGEQGFFGREDILRDLSQSLDSPDIRIITLFGQRRIGKSSLLFQLERRLSDERRRAVRFDLQGREHQPLGDVLAQLANAISRRVYGREISWASFDSGGRYFADSFLPGVLAHLGPRRQLVLLFDEFDVLDRAAREQVSNLAVEQALMPYLFNLYSRFEELRFVLVLGRRADELSYHARPMLRIAQNRSVAFLEPRDTRSLILTAEREGSLRFQAAAVERILQLTAGHPSFTQQLCDVIWNRAYELDPETAPEVDAASVDAAIEVTIDRCRNWIVDLWDNGLLPAEKVIVAAIAEAAETHPTASLAELDALLQQHGVATAYRDLQRAPERLVDLSVLQRVEGRYRLNVELMRLWVREHYPLEKLRQEIDRINPGATRRYLAAEELYNSGDLDGAAAQLVAMLRSYSTHIQARLLLAQILRDQGQLDEALRELEFAPAENPLVRAQVVETLIVKAETLVREREIEPAIEHYERVAGLEPFDRRAAEALARLRGEIERGDQARDRGDVVGAYRQYEAIGARQRMRAIQPLLFAHAAQQADEHARGREWARAEQIYAWLERHDQQKATTWRLRRAEARAFSELEKGLARERAGDWAEARRIYLELGRQLNEARHLGPIAKARALVCTMCAGLPISPEEALKVAPSFSKADFDVAIPYVAAQIERSQAHLRLLVRLVDEYRGQAARGKLTPAPYGEEELARLDGEYQTILRALQPLSAPESAAGAPPIATRLALGPLTELVKQYPLYSDAARRLYAVKYEQQAAPAPLEQAAQAAVTARQVVREAETRLEAAELGRRLLADLGRIGRSEESLSALQRILLMLLGVALIFLLAAAIGRFGAAQVVSAVAAGAGWLLLLCLLAPGVAIAGVLIVIFFNAPRR